MNTPPRKAWELPIFIYSSKLLRDTVAMHEWHAEVADYRMRHQGVLPELERYVAALCREAVR